MDDISEEYEFLFKLLNELFSGVSILVEWSEGSTTDGSLDGYYCKYYANTLTKEWRIVKRGDGLSEEEDIHRTRKIPLSKTMIQRKELKYLECLIELASADGNEELAAKITELAERVKAAK